MLTIIDYNRITINDYQMIVNQFSDQLTIIYYNRIKINDLEV